MSKATKYKPAASDFVLHQCGMRTQRQWKQCKRRQLGRIIRAVDAYRAGCAHCPGYPIDIQLLSSVLARMERSHSVKEWGR